MLVNVLTKDIVFMYNILNIYKGLECIDQLKEKFLEADKKVGKEVLEENKPVPEYVLIELSSGEIQLVYHQIKASAELQRLLFPGDSVMTRRSMEDEKTADNLLKAGIEAS